MAARHPAAQQPAAAGAAPGAQPQYSLPALTPEQHYVQKKQAEEIQRDVRSMGLDTTTPFTSLQDAIMRLLPFHLFNAADPALADLDDTLDHMGADLMASRHDAWEQLVMDKANDLRKRADGTSSNIADLESRMSRDALSGTRSTDHYAMARLQQDDLRRKIAADKAELQKLMPPVAPPAPPAAASASTGRTTPGPGSAGGLAGQQALQAAAAAAARGSAAGRGQQPMLTQVGVQQQLALLQQQQLINQLPIQQRLALQQQLALQQLQQQGQLPPGAQQAYMQALQQQALQQQALQQQQQQQQLLAQAIAQQQAQQRKQ